MVIVLQLSLCLYELQGSVVCVDDCFLSQNVMLPLLASLHNGIHLFIISGILLGYVEKCLTVICHWMPVLSNDFPNSIVEGICLDLKWLLQVWLCENWCRLEVMLQIVECLLLRFIPKEFLFHSSLGDLTQGPSDMRESQHKPAVEIGKNQKDASSIRVVGVGQS
jgi:hypothetical protein